MGLNTVLTIAGTIAGVVLGVIGSALYFLPKINERDWCIDCLIDELEGQELMDERFRIAAAKYKIGK